MFESIHSRSRTPLYCFFCLSLLLASPSFADTKKADAKNNPGGTENNLTLALGVENWANTDVLYYDWHTKIGIIQRNGKIFQIKLKNNGDYAFKELEGYPEGLPAPETHVQNYPDRLKQIENKAYYRFRSSKK